MYSNVFSSEIRQQNRTEQNRTEQNRTEQNRTEQNRTEPLQGFLRSQNRTGFLVKIEQSGLQNRHFQDFIANKRRTITKLILLQNKILQSLFQSFNRTIISYTKQNIIFNYFKIFYAIF